MDVQRLAFEFGVKLAAEANEADQYYGSVSERHPMSSRVLQWAGYGGGAGLLHGLLQGRKGKRLATGARHAGLGALLGLLPGAVHGGYDRGLVHALRVREDGSRDGEDSPALLGAYHSILPAILASSAKGMGRSAAPFVPAATALAAVSGKAQGASQPDALKRLRQMRRSEGGFSKAIPSDIDYSE